MTSLILGIAAGTLCTLSFVPQVIRIIRTRNTQDLSLLTFSGFSLGIFLWFLYGIAIQEVPVILANGVTLVLTLIIVAMKVRYG